MRWLSLLCASLALTCPVFGQLKWENPDQTVTARLFEKQGVLKYRFTNAGSTPLIITEVVPSCGCTTTALPKLEYAPGEAGELEVTIVFGAKGGQQEKTITVTTTETLDRPDVLRLSINVPEPVRVDPEFTNWPVGEKMPPRVIRVVVADDNPGRITTVKMDNPGVQMAVREIRPGKALEITVAPEDVSRAQNATVVITTDYPPQNPTIRHAYLVVR